MLYTFIFVSRDYKTNDKIKRIQVSNIIHHIIYINIMSKQDKMTSLKLISQNDIEQFVVRDIHCIKL